MDTKRIQQKIFAYYEEHGRDLPWRKTNDRYAVMVSEIMLQQTQVDRVIPKYDAWLQAFPSPSALAAAPLAEVLRLWSGLGYNNRAKRLHDAAKTIVKDHQGKVPDDVEELITLPGIGPYTARSILIFADNHDLATVDTNIRRILIRELKLKETTSDKELFEKAEELLPKGKSRDWHNALMDYGAMVLTSRKSGIRPKSTQSKFKDSKRYYRGQIVKQLTVQEGLCVRRMKRLFPECNHDLNTIAEDLVEEGLLEKKNGVFTLRR